MNATPPFDRSAAVGFSLNPLDRLSERREDEAFLAERFADPATRFVLLAGDVPVLALEGEAHRPLFSREVALALGPIQESVFLGVEPDGRALFAGQLDRERTEELAARPGLALVDLRSIASRGLIDAATLGELGGAKAMLDWHARHGFCANCGAPSKVAAAGWRRECPSCHALHFPRVDPVVIMCAIDGERCLLGRQARFAPGMYSALAGFLEPGETVEDAVRREIREEAGILTSRVAYRASQPWPFPSSLMIGCYAEAETQAVTIDRNELEDARWFSRDEVAAMLAGTHPGGLSAPLPFAIAHHLLKGFVEDGTDVLAHP